MASDLQSCVDVTFINVLSDWELWHIMRGLEDRELVDFSSTCHRFRNIAGSILARRAEMKTFTNIVFDSDFGCAANHLISDHCMLDDDPPRWIHPVEVIDTVQKTPRLAGYIQTIDFVTLRHVPPRPGQPCTNCYALGTIFRLHKLSNLRALVSRLEFLPADRQASWIRAIKSLNVTPAILLLVLLCPNLKSLRIKDAYNDPHFGSWVTDLSPMNFAATMVNNGANHSMQLAMPAIRTLSFDENSARWPAVNCFGTILHMTQIPGLRTLNGANISGHTTSTYWPRQQTSTIRNIRFVESFIQPHILLSLVRVLPVLEELMYSEVGWYAGGTTVLNVPPRTPGAYREQLLVQDPMYLESRRLYVVTNHQHEVVEPLADDDPVEGFTVIRYAIAIRLDKTV